MTITNTYSLTTTTPEAQANGFNTNDQRTPDVLGLSNGGYVVANNSDNGASDLVKLDFYNAAGVSIASVNAYSDNDIHAVGQPQLTQLANGNVLVVWEDENVTDTGLYGRIFSATGVAAGNEFILGTNSSAHNNPDVIALPNGNFVLTEDYTGNVFFGLYDANGATLNVDMAVNTTITGAQGSARVTVLTDGGFAVSFVDENAGNHLFTRTYDADGTARQAAQVLIDNIGANTDPAIVGLANGNYAIAYVDTGWGGDGGSGISLAIRDASGAAVGGIHHVNDVTSLSSEFSPAITVLKNGFIVVSWTTTVSLGTGNIYGRIYDQDGNAVTVDGNSGDFVITNTAGADIESAVSALLDGAFVTVWQDSESDTSGGRITSEINELTRTATGDAGDDVFLGDALDETIDGGAGNNTYSIAGDTQGATIVLGAANNQVMGTGTGTDQLANIQNVIGGDGVDEIIGDNNANIIRGGRGIDALTGNGGDDIFEEAHGDSNTGGEISGGAGTDTIRGISAGTVAGVDFISLGSNIISSIERIDFASDASERHIRFNADQYGGGGISLSAEITSSFIPAGHIVDRLDTNMGAQTALDFSGLTFSGGANIQLYYYGSAANLDHTITGSSAKDVFRLGDGANTMIGGAGNDYYLADGNDIVQEALGEGTDTVESAGTYTLSNHVENLVLTGDGNGIGNTQNNTIRGSYDFYNSLFGATGEDSLILSSALGGYADGGAGIDSVSGGSGADRLYGGTENDTLNGNGGNDQIYGEAGGDILRGGTGEDYLDGGDGIDNLFGGDDGDRLYGGGSNDSLSGEGGNDLIYGEAGNDFLFGNDGEDVLEGGAGVDIMDGGALDDRLFGGDDGDNMSGGTGNDRVNGEAGNDMLHGDAGDDLLDGGAGNDFLYGGADTDRLYGGTEDDTLHGDGENDVLYGEDGIDTLFGDAGDDGLEGGNGADTLNGGVGDDRLYGDAGDDTLRGGDDTDWLFGLSDNDALYGDAGDDVLQGGDGADHLYGGTGDDRLYGEAGVDRFYFAGSWGIDKVYGYEAGEKLDFTPFSLGNISALNITTVGADIQVSYLGNLLILDGAAGVFDSADIIV